MSVPFSNGRPLPAEVLELIAFEVVADDPLAPLSTLLPLLLTTRAIHAALAMDSGTLLYSRVCRLKFDVGPVTRRAFTPRTKDLNGHLVQMCTLLKVLRNGDIYHEDVDDSLLIAYVAMLDNDGKNRVQLEHVGIVGFVDRFVRERLLQGREHNCMWPSDDVTNASALWLKWMFTTREELLEETVERREEIINIVFPYLMCPLRYSSALVPPNHFSLPLGGANQIQRHVYTITTAHGQYPLYHRTDAESKMYYFRSNIPFIEPLAAPVAALLFWCRRELNGSFIVPVELPATRNPPGRPGMTQEDLIEYNSYKVAKLPDVVRWDWTRGTAVKHAADGSGSVVPWKESDSERWDIDWWRARLCRPIFNRQPKYRSGHVYVRGMMSGLWQGVAFSYAQNVFTNIQHQSQFPSNLSEATTFYSGRPLLMRLQEHGFVRTPVEPTARPVPSAPAGIVSATLTHGGRTQNSDIPVDFSLGNAWFPGPIGSVKWVENKEPMDAGVLKDRFISPSVGANGSKPVEAMGSTVFLVGEGSVLAVESEGTRGGGPVDQAMLAGYAGRTYLYERYDAEKQSVHQRMVDANRALAVCGPSTSAPASTSATRGHTASSPTTATNTPLSTPQPTSTPPTLKLHPGCLKCADRAAFLKNRKARDVSGWTKTQKYVEAAFSTVGMDRKLVNLLSDEERFMDALGNDTGDGGSPDVLELELDAEEGSEGEDGEREHDHGEMEEEDSRPPVSELVPITSPPSPTSRSRSSTPSTTGEGDGDDMAAGDDVPVDLDEGHPGICDKSSGNWVMEPIRRSHDRYRVERCDDGVEDVLLTGEMDERHRLAWGKSTYYGRVRPWDGMVAILRIVQGHYGSPNSHMIYYGYLYGGDTFVGNWRYAGLDPLVPTFECSFIMSKRADGVPSAAPLAVNV